MKIRYICESYILNSKKDTVMARFLVITIMALCASIMSAQSVYKSGFTVSAGADFSVNQQEFHPEIEFWGTTIAGGYKFMLYKGLFVQPELSLYYENHKLTQYLGGYPEPGTGTPRKNEGSHSSEFGFGLSAIAGYSFNCYKSNTLDLFTGPIFNCALEQHENLGGHRISDNFNAIGWRWQLGARLNINHISVKVAYNWGLSNLNKYAAESDVVSVGVGYNF